MQLASQDTPTWVDIVVVKDVWRIKRKQRLSESSRSHTQGKSSLEAA